MIYNKDANKSYGYLASSSVSISSDSYKTISVRVKTVNAKASIYLIDADGEDNASLALATPKVSYWYDKTGNVCTKDPKNDKTFKSSTDTALYLNSRGLYEVNAKCRTTLLCRTSITPTFPTTKRTRTATCL